MGISGPQLEEGVGCCQVQCWKKGGVSEVQCWKKGWVVSQVPVLEEVGGNSQASVERRDG